MRGGSPYHEPVANSPRRDSVITMTALPHRPSPPEAGQDPAGWLWLPVRRRSRGAALPGGRDPGRPAAAAVPGVELVRVAAGEAELRALVERSRSADPPGAPAPPPSAGTGQPPAGVRGAGPPAAGAPGRPAEGGAHHPEAGLLVLSERGHARYALQHLTGREREVLALMAEGRSNAAIAERLVVTEHTIEKHIKNIFAALRLAPSSQDHRRVLAVLAYLRAGHPPARR